MQPIIINMNSAFAGQQMIKRNVWNNSLLPCISPSRRRLSTSSFIASASIPKLKAASAVSLISQYFDDFVVHPILSRGADWFVGRSPCLPKRSWTRGACDNERASRAAKSHTKKCIRSRSPKRGSGSEPDWAQESVKEGWMVGRWDRRHNQSDVFVMMMPVRPEKEKE